MPIEETGEKRVSTDFLNIDVSLHMQMKKQISVRIRRHWDYFSWNFRSRCSPRLHKIS